MTTAHRIRKLALKFGVEMNRYIPSRSPQARIFRQLAVHGIDTVLDIGANDGGYGHFLREGGYHGDILSFEPLSAPYQSLLDATASDARWHVGPQVALGSEDGDVEINVAGNSTSSSILSMCELHAQAAPQSLYTGVERVAICRLDSVAHPVIDGSRRLYIKIDTQGYEMQVLSGAETLFQKVQGVQLELSIAPLYEGQALYREVIDWLSIRGFELWSVVPGFTDNRTGRMLQFDGIFFRSVEVSKRDYNEHSGHSGL